MTLRERLQRVETHHCEDCAEGGGAMQMLMLGAREALLHAKSKAEMGIVLGGPATVVQVEDIDLLLAQVRS